MRSKLQGPAHPFTCSCMHLCPDAEAATLAQAHDERFVNACVSFDAATLRPKYELLWGTTGRSNALAVAEGLRF